MNGKGIFVSELSTSGHLFNKYHFCRGNSNRRKTRLGIIVKGRGAYIYLNKKLEVREGDVVFIPENIYCYSEWFGEPEIEVRYVSCFIHWDKSGYEPQIIPSDRELKDDLAKISELLGEDSEISTLEAYSMFYKVLKKVLPEMSTSSVSVDKTLQTALEYITNNWNKIDSVSDIAKRCCISESQLYHLFRKELGETPVGFLNSIKINVAIEYLENRDYSIATVSRLVGFNSENHFRKVFAEYTGTTPLKYRKGTK